VGRRLRYAWAGGDLTYRFHELSLENTFVDIWVARSLRLVSLVIVRDDLFGSGCSRGRFVPWLKTVAGGDADLFSSTRTKLYGTAFGS